MLEARNRRLLFRSYLSLAGGLLIMAIVLDLGFGYLQTRNEPETDRWLESTFTLLVEQLTTLPPESRQSRTQSLSRDLAFNIQLLPRDAVVFSETGGGEMAPLVDSDGGISYLRDAPEIDAVIRIGPIAQQTEGWLLRLVPPLFYLSILVVVGLWLRPLLRDIGLISDAAQRFAADYRQPLTTAANVTELRGLARNLDEMAARLSAVLSNQKELIAALSHEMRTPLARIRFALAVGSEEADSNLRQRLESIDGDVQEIDNLITSMLSYARLDHPDTGMHWQSVPASAWIDRIIGKVSTAEIPTEAHIDPRVSSIRMDAKLMELALSNLLVNAHKYASRTVRCSISLDDGDFCLRVEDDGPGIPVEARSEVFRAFKRLDNSRSRDTGGSGLGLAVVARIAELHGGSVNADESPELGGARLSIRWNMPRSDTGEGRDILPGISGNHPRGMNNE